jgi:hypothetical protein
VRDDRAELRTLAFALLASLLLWNLPYGGAVLYPFKLLATWFHEMSHGILMLVTGAGLNHIQIFRDTSGLSFQNWKISDTGTAFIAAAGYMGTPLWGALLLAVTPTARAARITLLVIAGLMLVTAVVVIAPTDDDGRFGPFVVAGMGVALAACALFVPARWRVLGAHFIAAQLCVNALLDIRVLLRPQQVVNGTLTGHSDASEMAFSTFGVRQPWAVWFWACVWLAWSLAVLFVALRFSGSRATRLAATSAPTTA